MYLFTLKKCLTNSLVLGQLHVAPGNRLDTPEKSCQRYDSASSTEERITEAESKGVTPRDLYKSTWPLLEDMAPMTHFLLVTLRLDLTMCLRLSLNLLC